LNSPQCKNAVFNLITLAERLSSFLGISEATISNKCTSHARFFKRLRDGYGCSVDTFNSVSQWFSDHYPEGLEWPRDIPRPPQSKKKEVA